MYKLMNTIIVHTNFTCILGGADSNVFRTDKTFLQVSEFWSICFRMSRKSFGIYSSKYKQMTRKTLSQHLSLKCWYKLLSCSGMKISTVICSAPLIATTREETFLPDFLVILKQKLVLGSREEMLLLHTWKLL